jgi:hypothetical protein
MRHSLLLRGCRKNDTYFSPYESFVLTVVACRAPNKETDEDTLRKVGQDVIINDRQVVCLRKSGRVIGLRYSSLRLFPSICHWCLLLVRRST